MSPARPVRPVSAPTTLHIDNLRFAYPGDPPIVDGWSAAIGPGVTLLHGDTGSGKSTLLRVLAGALPATGGRLTLAGASLPGAVEAYRHQVFFVDPSTDAFDAMGVQECAAALREADAPFDAARWQALVDGFSLAPHLEKKMFMLSTGSKRKVWLAAALASSRPLTLLDAPTAGLDTGSMRCLWRTLAEVAQEGGRTVVVASGEPVDDVPLARIITLPMAG